MWRAPCYDRRPLPRLTFLLESSVFRRHSKDSCALRSGCRLTCWSPSRIVRSMDLVFRDGVRFSREMYGSKTLTSVTASTGSPLVFATLRIAASSGASYTQNASICRYAATLRAATLPRRCGLKPWGGEFRRLPGRPLLVARSQPSTWHAQNRLHPLTKLGSGA